MSIDALAQIFDRLAYTDTLGSNVHSHSRSTSSGLLFCSAMNLKRMLYRWPAVVSSLSFCCLGIVFFRYPGLQNDELLFAATIFRRSASVYILPIGRGLPLMMMSYLGTLKSWLFGPLIRYSVSEATIRLPVVLLGAITIWLTYQLVERMHSRRAAIVTVCILATDACFFLTTCFDWGPVGFQHFFLVTGLLLTLRFAQHGGRPTLFLAFLAFGLGLWDKALFVWMLSGLAAGAVIVYPLDCFRRMNFGNIATASLGLVLGASPLIAYNVAQPWETFRSNSHFVFNEFGAKGNLVRATVRGGALQGYLTLPDSAPAPHSPSNVTEDLSFRLHSLTGAHPDGYQEQASIAALLLFPLIFFTRARRILLFLLLAFITAWVQMAITHNAGGTVHHIILLWPLPAIFLGVTFAQASLRLARAGPWLLALVTLTILGANLVSLNEYLYAFIRNGAAGSWSDAIKPLAKNIPNLHPSRVIVYDWGIAIPVEVINRERIHPEYAELPMFPASIGETERKFRTERLEDPGAIWVGHTAGNEQFPGSDARLMQEAHARGLDKESLSTVADSHGRALFQLFRLHKPADGVQLQVPC